MGGTDCVNEHNKKRVGNLRKPLMPVHRDPDAIMQALKYMEEVVNNGCPFKHSGAPGFGENLFATSGPVARCRDAVGAWYSEIRYFNGEYPGGKWTVKAGHFTQVMWSSSTGIGCARSIGCPNRILVCNYRPPGNWIGAKPFSEEVWNSIMEASGDSPQRPVGPWTVTAIAALVSLLLSLEATAA
ncbi:pathogenesis-related protein 1 [Cyclospora cayetanensis]|uniref:Pathogenesis-related protein 1 n=1 Tax=Cyclospora cayetanensis TaxID=88456 RepID=A0A6P6S413_9EIME|nr:pathogenesis-related protein 1 [Cyclospora cayetanensis]